MSNIDSLQWRKFRIGDIFETTANKKHVPTGASIPKSELIENGKTPRISVTGTNNGILGYYDYKGSSPQNYRVYNNFISVSFLGTVFYQQDNASLDMKVHCLKPLGVTLNRYTGTFLVSAIKASLRLCSYADQISSSILPDLYINLPATAFNQPDWMYMEKYIQSMEKIIIDRVQQISDATNVNREIIETSLWRRFHLGNNIGVDLN